MKKYLVSILLLCFAAMAFAQKNTGRVIIPESNLEFKANSDYTEVTITGFKYSSYSENKKFDGRVIEIPSKIQGVPVTAIGREAFTYKGDGISGLWIPDSVKDIGSYAFQCAYFGSIRLPEGLKTITTGMLNSCRTKSVTIPSSVTKISSWAFSDSEIESVSIPKGCTIVGGSGDSMAAFQNCSKLKSVTFPSGRVYFEAEPIDPDNNWAWSGEGIFRNCDSLVNISIPKGFEAVYRSEYDFADHTLADYISGKKLSENFSAQKALKSVKVRNAAVVDHEAYLAAYNQALKSGDYTRAMLLAKQYKEYYPYYKSSEWTAKYNEAIEKPYLDAYNKALASKDYNKAIQFAKEFKEKNPSVNTNEWTKRYTDIAEKTYLDEYNKAMASKDWEKAKKIINEFMGKISSDSSLSSLESKWDDMLFDVDCKMYLPAYVEKLEKKGSVVYLNSSLQFKIPLTEDVYENPRFNFTDSDGNGLWNTGYTLFLKKIKEFTGKDYQIYDSYSNPYLYRDATAEESSAYYQVRKDAVKQFMESAVNASVIEKDGLNSLYKIYLADNIYSYRKDAFSITDASGNVYTISEDDFLNYVKEVCGTEYKLCGSYYSNYSYLYRNATEAELAAYHQVRKDVVKYFMEEAVKNGTVEKDGSNLLLKIYLSKDTYSYNNDTFTVKDSSGTAYTLSDKDFLSYAKEVCGMEYKLYGSASYLYRNATAEEIAAYHQPRKDAVKYFMEEAVKKGTVEKDSSNLLFKIYLSDSTYSYSNSKFTVKDSSGTAYTLSDKDFLSYAKEVCGTEYNLYYKYNGSYLYRNATEEETDTFYKSRKEAIKIFMDNAVKNGTIKKDGSNLIFKFYLSDSIFDYHNGIFTVKDSKDKTYTLAKDDFLSSVKESCGIEYDMYWTHFSDCSFLFRNATAEEAAAYHQPKIDALKPFLDDVMKGAKFEKQGSNLLFKIYFPYLSYNYNSGSYSFKDSSGKTYTVDGTYFLSYVKEICGASYELSVNGNTNSYLYRNATDEEISAYQQPRKDAVKQFMDRALNVAVIEKDGSNSLLKIYLADDTYSYGNDSFYMIDSSGNKYTLSDKDFLAYAKEVCGTEYKLHGYYSGSYLYRNATTEEIKAYYQVRKDAVKQFMERAVNVGVIEKDGSNLLFKIYLSESTYNYRNSKFTIKDSSGNAYTLSNDDFLSYAKETSGIDYKLYGSYRDPYLYAKANDMLQLKCVFAFQNGNLHTNLVYKLKDKWEFPVEFAESNDTVTVKSFKVKKSVFEENGLKTKDVVKKIVVSDAYGNETEIDWKDLPNVQAPSTLLITVVRGSGKKAQTYIVKVPVEWDVDEMKSIKDILDFKCILAFQNGTLHTNLACNVDGKWMYVAEFVESKGEVIIKSFRAKKSVLERVGLKTKDVIKKVVLIDDSENEIAVVNNLFEIQAPATLRFTVERGSGKKAQTMIFDVPVEWNEDEVKNLR